MKVEKNDPLPESYFDHPYYYYRNKVGTRLEKNKDERFLFGDDETQFFKECNRAKQKGRSLSDVIEEYFISTKSLCKIIDDFLDELPNSPLVRGNTTARSIQHGTN